jgi:hypothetical protein
MGKGYEIKILSSKEKKFKKVLCFRYQVFFSFDVDFVSFNALQLLFQSYTTNIKLTSLSDNLVTEHLYTVAVFCLIC